MDEKGCETVTGENGSSCIGARTSMYKVTSNNNNIAGHLGFLFVTRPSCPDLLNDSNIVATVAHFDVVLR